MPSPSLIKSSAPPTAKPRPARIWPLCVPAITVPIPDSDYPYEPGNGNRIAVARESTDTEGWTLLGGAIKQLQDFPSEKVAQHCEQFGLKSVSSLLLASGLFEIRMHGASEAGKGKSQYRLLRPASATACLSGSSAS